MLVVVSEAGATQGQSACRAAGGWEPLPSGECAVYWRRRLLAGLWSEAASREGDEESGSGMGRVLGLSVVVEGK